MLNAETTKRERMAAMIRALLAKTAENGCTEGEAQAAADKARELMDRWNIDRGAIGMEEEGTTRGRAESKKYGRIIVSDYLAGAVAAYCDCKSWITSGGLEGRASVFFGLRSDVDFATWLLASLSSYVSNAAREHGRMLPAGKARWNAEKGFIAGAVSRISQRLRTATAERQAAQRAAAASAPVTGTSLVVVKGAIVERDFRKLGIKLGSRRGGFGGGSSSSYGAGAAAGDRAGFGRGIEPDSQRRIGSR